MRLLDIKQQDLWSYLDNSSSPVALYGTGDGADKIIKVLEERGLFGRVQAVFASDGFVRNRTFCGFKVESFDEVRARLGDGMIVLVCFGSALPEVLDNIERISKICETLIPDVPVCGDTLFDSAFAEENEDRLGRVYESLEDDISRECFANYVNYKLTGRTDLLEASETSDDEVSFLAGVPAGTYFLDLGAYNGDTVRRYMDLLPDGFLQVLGLGADEEGCVEFRIDLVTGLQCLEGLDGHSVGAAESETDEDKFGCHRRRMVAVLLNLYVIHRRSRQRLLVFLVALTSK